MERHPLQPFLPANARMLMLGSFPPPRERWTIEFYYPNFQNDMWRIFGVIFFNDRLHFVDEHRKSFKESNIKQFLLEKGIALYDTAEEIIRQRGNASDQYLEIIKPVDLKRIVEQIPECNTIVTTGQKATETLMELIGIKHIPPLGSFVETSFMNRIFRCYRMPSSSRAYPKSIAEKTAAYRQMFLERNVL